MRCYSFALSDGRTMPLLEQITNKSRGSGGWPPVLLTQPIPPGNNLAGLLTDVLLTPLMEFVRLYHGFHPIDSSHADACHFHYRRCGSAPSDHG